MYPFYKLFGNIIINCGQKMLKPTTKIHRIYQVEKREKKLSSQILYHRVTLPYFYAMVSAINEIIGSPSRLGHWFLCINYEEKTEKTVKPLNSSHLE